MKKCGRCKVVKENGEFSNGALTKSGGRCRACNTFAAGEYRKKNSDKIKRYQKEYDAIYYQKNKEEKQEYKKQYYQDNREEVLESSKIYDMEHKEEKQEYNRQYYQDNREYAIEYAKEYRLQNLDKVKEYQNQYGKERRANDPNFRIRGAITANIAYHLRRNGSSKNGDSCLNHLPETIEELRRHLENLWNHPSNLTSEGKAWMTWENYGRYNPKTWKDDDISTHTWQIDHIIPHSTFKYTSMESEEFKKCWSLDNLRPLNSKQNFLDGVQRSRHN